MLFENAKRAFKQWPDAVLTLALLAGAAVIILVALQPGHRLLKATVLAYIVLP
jgi:hypothetical protein